MEHDLARGYHEGNRKPPPSTKTISATTTTTTAITTQSNPGPDDVLQAHNYHGSQVIEEFCDRLLTTTTTTNNSSKADLQIQSLIRNEAKIQTWLHDPTSSILLLSGGQDPNKTFQGIPFETGKPPLSGISFVTAELLQQYSSYILDGLDEEGDVVVIPLIFFCTLQRRRWQGRLTPRDMAMNLLMQLVDKYRYRGDGGDGLGFSSGQMMHSCIYRVASLRDICARFTELVLEIIAAGKSSCSVDGTTTTGSSTTSTTTTTTLFILIDGTHELSIEGGAFHAEYALILDHLLALFHLDNHNHNHNHNHNQAMKQKTDTDTTDSDSGSGSLRMKLLFAGPAGSVFVEQFRSRSTKTTVVTIPTGVVKEIEEKSVACKN